MPLVSCPDCGAQVSDAAIVCAQCGFPLRRDVLARSAAGRAGGGSSRSNAAGIVIGVVVAGLMGVVVIGILAALAIPRFTMATQRAKEKDGERLLKQVFTLENAYYANNGAYAPSIDELRSVGWEPADSALNYEPEVTLSPERDAIVCLDARPKRGADVQPLSMDSVGVMYHDEHCSGETLGQSRATTFRPVEATDLSGEGGDPGARTLLREVYAGMAEYRAENGRDPTELGQVLQHVHFSRASNENSLALGSRRGRVCVSTTPAGSEPPGRHQFSVDGEGRMYEGGACSGAFLEQVAAPAPSTKPAGK
jgi:Tfp pilus assembly protein PilE